MSKRATERDEWTDEELARTLENTASLLNAGIPTLPENEHLVDRYMEAARRLRAASTDAPEERRLSEVSEALDIAIRESEEAGNTMTSLVHVVASGLRHDVATEPADAAPDRGGEPDDE